VYLFYAYGGMKSTDFFRAKGRHPAPDPALSRWKFKTG
jgi:hypothetical protein